MLETSRWRLPKRIFAPCLSPSEPSPKSTSSMIEMRGSPNENHKNAPRCADGSCGHGSAPSGRFTGRASALRRLERCRSDIQTEYDLAALGKVESIHGPFWNPPRWMVSYKEKISAKHGHRIQPKEQKGDQVGLAIQQTGW